MAKENKTPHSNEQSQLTERPEYFVIIPAIVRFDTSLNPFARLLFGDIAALAKSKGYCWASNNYFASLYSVDVLTISRRITELINAGHLKSKIIYKNGSKEIEERRLTIDTPLTNKSVPPIDVKVNTPLTNKSVPPIRINQYPIDVKVKDNSTLINTDNNTINSTNLNINDDSVESPVSEIKNDLFGTRTGKPEKPIKEKKKAKDKTPEEQYQLDCFNQAKSAWFEYHPGWNFDGGEGAALKSLIKKMNKTVTAGKPDIAIPLESIKENFRILLDCLPDWYKSQNLKVINSKYDTLISEILKTSKNEQPINRKDVFTTSKYAPQYADGQ